MYTDASGIGYGGTYGSSWICGLWPASWRKYNIVILEIYPILATLGTFATKLKISVIYLHCDNSAVVSILNNQPSHDAKVMFILRLIVLTQVKFNITLKAKHIPGVNNTLADKLSRLQISPALLASHCMNPMAEMIPHLLLPKNLKIVSET